jgi:segregation and condensation protein A
MQNSEKQYSGPLDFLLQLLESEDMNITEISLSSVTEKYLHHIDAMEEKHPEELVDFLVVAAKLVLLKSKKLLPQLLPDEEDGIDLESQLKLYKQFVEASKDIDMLWLSEKRSVFRVEPTRKSVGFVPPNNVNIESLRESFEKLVYRLTPPKPLPKTTIDKAVSMKAKILHIHKALQKKKKAYFFDILENSKNKTDIIVSFLAILELVKQKTVSLHQDDSFSDILIKRI